MAFLSGFSLRRLAAAALSLSILAACSSNPPKTGDNPEAAPGPTESNSAEDTKNSLKGVGADIGCGIATLIRKDCAKGAEIGARVVDKALSWVFRSIKLLDGKKVNQEYEDKKVAVPKNDIKPMAFDTTVQSASEGSAQVQEVKVTSNTDLVGYGDKVPEVSQRYALYDEKNKLVGVRTEKLAAVDGAGRYESEAKIKIPKGSAKKRYRVETALVVNGKPYKKNSYQVAVGGDGFMTIAHIPGLPGG